MTDQDKSGDEWPDPDEIAATLARTKQQVIELMTTPEKVDERLAWLERKTVETLWGYTHLTAAFCGAIASWVAYTMIEIRSFWILVPLGMAVWGAVFWWLKRQTFKDAPPHINRLG